jgi:uncharacterized protein (TIGR03437 family)
MIKMRFFAAAFLFAAPLLAQGDCTFIVSRTSFPIDASRFSGSVMVTAPASNCSFSAVVPQTVNWIHITSAANGSTPGTVTFTVDANPGTAARSGAMTIALQTVTVSQAGRSDCAFAVSPTSQSFPVAGGSSSFGLKANCPWSAVPSTPWITFPGGAQTGLADTTIRFGVIPNTCVSTRGGGITIVTGLATQPVFSITQDGSPDNLTVTPIGAPPGAAAGDYRMTINTGVDCSWSAFSDVSWLQITSGGSGTGVGSLVYHLLENKGTARTGGIHIGALTYSVTQPAPAAVAVVVSSVANGASYATDAVSPGEIVTLFGTNMGPASIVTLQVANNTVTNSLAGTQVFFDDAAAPMIYTLAGQLSAVVPYAVAGKSSTKVSVQYNGIPSNTVTMPVQPATPAIFSRDSSGAGPGAILNQDNSLNSSANPAAAGSIVAIYLTGGGVTTPASGDGAVTGVPPPVLAPATTVTIGGVNAVVKFAGAAPGSVAGLTQINVEVPAGVTGIALPVIVKIGNFSSTGAATVAVK